MCKHFHLALHVAARRGLDVEQMRRRVADDIIISQSYEVVDDEVLVFQDIMTVVSGKRCTCIAASHGLYCVCRLVSDAVAKLEDAAATNTLPLPVDDDTPASPINVADDIPTAADPTERELTKNEETALKLLDCMSDYIRSGLFAQHPRQNVIMSDLKHLNNKLHFIKNVRKVPTKIQQNSSARKAIESSKRKAEHGYEVSSKKFFKNKKSKHSDETQPQQSFKGYKMQSRTARNVLQ